MGKKKINPHRRPATWADVEKARAQGRKEGIVTTMKICLFVLMDNFGFGKKRSVRFWNLANGYAEDLGNGNLKQWELDNAMLEEYKIEVE